MFYQNSDPPHASELQQLFEHFHAEAFPRKEICLAGHKCKSGLANPFLDYVVHYSLNLLHAMDGLGSGLVMVPVNGNFLLKIYSENKAETYSSIIFAMLEL